MHHKKKRIRLKGKSIQGKGEESPVERQKENYDGVIKKGTISITRQELRGKKKKGKKHKRPQKKRHKSESQGEKQRK